MNFTISSTALSGKLSSLSRVINSKNPIAILESFLFEIKDGKLFLTASDGDNVMKTSLILDEVEGEGAFAVNNKNILDAVKELPEQPLHINVNMDELRIMIEYQNGYYDFPIISSTEYPVSRSVDEPFTTITLSSEILLDNITRSLFATAQDELRPIMNGIYFDLQKDHLAIVATDGHKLVRNRNTSIKSEKITSFILPKKPASLLKSSITKEDNDVVIRFDSKVAEFSYVGGSLSCSLIEGKYPNYNGVIPENNPNQITIDRKSLIGALRRVLPFASDSSELIRFSVSNSSLEVNAEDFDFSTKAKEKIICNYSGTPMSIGFKGSNFIEILNNLQGDDVNIELADPSRAGIIIPVEQPENQDVLMLIMPMLLND